jgi:threonine aldolase
VMPVETNIIIFSLKGRTAPELVAQLKEKNILAYAITPRQVRLVVHLDITPEMIAQTLKVISEL